ncbi:MAG: vitamin K epoxide reductase family protein [Gemmatimonadetes bacterium]|nr:vitamin K epoxide reductase family protein [Gemmatimonadota bacterium]
MTRRMLIAVLALVGLFVAVYLWMFKLGLIGSLSCKIGGCDKVNTSPWAMFLGQPVAFWGVLYYVGTFAAAYAATLERFAADRRAALLLVGLTGWGVLFSGYLTYLEAAVIHAWCQWCVVSAIIICIMFVLAVWEWRRAE